MTDWLRSLPGETVAYVEGYGVTTVGEIRASEQKPALDVTEATYQMWEDVATRNLLRKPWEPSVSVSAIKAFHAARYTSGQTARATT